tara:strand:- start:1445 stop:1939 length:495 start_codon:yes stop_codon:yes gene_type:complete
MIIKLNKNIISVDQFKLNCSVGKGGIRKKIKEGDKITPKGTYYLGKVYYRSDRIKNFRTRLNRKIIKKNMGWSDDPNSKNYNLQININKNYKYSYERLYRNDHKYDLIIPVKYNSRKPIKNKGSAIFLHLTKNYKPTNGCIALKKKDFFVLLNLINKKTKIKIF